MCYAVFYAVGCVVALAGLVWGLLQRRIPNPQPFLKWKDFQMASDIPGAAVIVMGLGCVAFPHTKWYQPPPPPVQHPPTLALKLDKPAGFDDDGNVVVPADIRLNGKAPANKPVITVLALPALDQDIGKLTQREGRYYLTVPKEATLNGNAVNASRWVIVAVYDDANGQAFDRQTFETTVRDPGTQAVANLPRAPGAAAPGPPEGIR